jgi:tetratricopeptide (TPR) repeat protein
MAVRALLQRRLGRWDEALALQRQAVDTDPRSILAWSTLTETLVLMRRYDDVEDAVARHLSISPTSPFAIQQRLVTLIDGRGDTARGRAVFDETRPLLPLFTVSLGAHHLAYYTRDLAAMQAAPVASLQDQAFFSNRYHRHLYHAVLARREGNLTHAAAHADSLRAHARRHLARRGNAADPFGSRELAEMNVALADAVSGDAAAAVARAEEMVRRLPLSRDAVEGTSMLRWLAMTYALAGRHADAIRTLETLLKIPSDIGHGALRLDPVWDDLRGNPAFEALLR